MRNRFLSHTLRNFSLYFMTCISPEETRKGIEDILQKMKQQFHNGTDLQKLINDVKTNVGQANMPLFRMMPRRLKHLVLKTGTSIYGERLQTSPFSNLGVVKMPDELEKHVRSFGFLIGQTQINTVYAAAVTFKDTLYWDITSVVQEDRIESLLENTLRECGIPYVRCAARTNREEITQET